MPKCTFAIKHNIIVSIRLNLNSKARRYIGSPMNSFENPIRKFGSPHTSGEHPSTWALENPKF